MIKETPLSSHQQRRRGEPTGYPKWEGFGIVQKGIPIPDKSRTQYRSNAVWSWFMGMEPGDSVPLRLDEYKRAWAAARWWGKRYHIEMRLSKEHHPEVGAYYRIWRVK